MQNEQLPDIEKAILTEHQLLATVLIGFEYASSPR